MQIYAVTLSLILGAAHLIIRDGKTRTSAGMVKNMSIELPRSAIIVLDRLTSEGPMTPKAISSRVDLAPRTVSFALRKLMGQSLCKKIPNLSDMRQPLYAADMERAKALRSRFEHVFRQVLV